jgi:predicted dehydrogenase
VHDDREGLFIRHGRYSRLQQLDFGSELTTETHYENLLSDFAEAVSRRHHYETDSRAILSGLSIVEASVKSAEEERTVEIRELFPDESMLT